METAVELAKRLDLEYYLDKPDELNNAIFNLMLLQETLQMEQARRMKISARTISIKRSAHGKFIIACSGDPAYRYAVETALKAGTAVIPVFQRSRFIKMLRSMGIPENRIAQYSDSITVDDDTLCIDQE
jgi:hypothetical protein